MREEGTVKWFSSEKGYGFIKPDNGTADLFVHHTGINETGYRTLDGVDCVSFARGEGKKGQQAIEVSILSRLPETTS